MITVDHIPRNTPHNRRPGIRMQPQWITIHSTGNPSSTAANERAWLTNPNNPRQASYHYVVDATQTIECIPPTEVAWHAGDGRGQGNYASVGIEICESGDRERTLAAAADLAAEIMGAWGWSVERLKRHYDWSGKICPRILYDGGSWAGWEQFKREVERRLTGQVQPARPAQSTDQQPHEWAREAWQWAIERRLTDGTNPRAPLTREQMMVILHRFAGGGR